MSEQYIILHYILLLVYASIKSTKMYMLLKYMLPDFVNGQSFISFFFFIFCNTLFQFNTCFTSWQRFWTLQCIHVITVWIWIV